MRRRWLGPLLALSACGGDEAPPCPSPPTPGDAPFIDATDALGIAFEHHLASDLSDTIGGPGACVFDFDGDGRLDLYLVDRAGHPNALYRNEGATFRDVTEESGASLVGIDGMGCLAFDHDADGDLDLLVTANGPSHLLRNDAGVFTDVTEASGLATHAGFAVSASAGDVDGDRDLDLFVGRVVDLASCPEQCSLFPIACKAQQNLLFINDGGVFREEAAARGLVEAEPTLATLMVDIDRDGDLDIYAGNDMGFAFPDRLYRNDGSGHFADAAQALGLHAKGSDTMGVDVGDFDRDGNTDWLMSDFEDRPLRLIRCYDPSLPCSYEVVPDSLDHVKWGLGLVDFDQDGWLDVLVAGGHVAHLEGNPTRLFYQRAGEFVESVPRPGEALATPATGRGLSFGDLDGDGAVDAVLAVASGRPRVLLNRAHAGYGLTVTLDPLAAGARVSVTTPRGRVTEHALVGGSYAGSSDPRVHFGLGESCDARVEVDYLDGRNVVVERARGELRLHR
ncbi:MAG: CRTAC1 family protein [Deltaproteobacteria bacterium]|nr:CRTAC1 family protein [Deltaproteobacteria bacterium]